LHHRFNTLFAALVKQGFSSGAGDLHGLRYAAQVDGLEGMQDATLGGRHGTLCHVLNSLAELEQPAPALAPAALHQGATEPSARVTWLGRGRKWSPSTGRHVDESHIANKKNGADELKVGAGLWADQQA
jgi:hypothetical protein